MKRWPLILTTISLLIILFMVFQNDKSKPSVLSNYDENYSVFQKFIPFFSNDELEQRFSTVKNLAQEQSGTYGIYIKDLSNQKVYEYNESELFYGASLYKVPLAVATMKAIQESKLEYGDTLTYQSIDYFGGTGSINAEKYGTEFTVNDVLNKLLKESDNSAQNMLWRKLNQEEIMNAFNIMTIRNYFYVNNTATPEQIGNYFEELMNSNYLSSSNREVLFNKMSETLFDDRINDGLDQGLSFSHKIGNWPETGTWHDCGIASDEDSGIIVCVMSRGTTYEQFDKVTKETGDFVSTIFTNY